MATNKEVMTVTQRIIGLDTQYNPLRPLPSNQYKMLYLRRRNQLLQEKARNRDDPSIRHSYLVMRSQILGSRYGPIEKKSSSHNNKKNQKQNVDSLSKSPGETSFLSPSPMRFQPAGLVPTRAAQASRAMAGDNTLQEHYAFCGMQHIFDQHKGGVAIIKFANDDRTLLACGSRDATLSVFNLVSEPPSLHCTLRGHEKEINDFDWSIGNDFIVSASSDGTYRLWKSNNGKCLRIISDTSGCQSNCCCFHSQNGNFLITGNSKGQLKVYNVSTGKGVKGGNSKTAGSVLSLALESSGGVVWASDSKGSMFSFLMDSVSGRLHRLKRLMIEGGVPITSVSCRTWASREARDPTLLLSCADNSLRIYRILSNGDVYLKRKMAVPHSNETIRSAFCPLMSFLQGACVVSGGEDGHVYMYDIETGSQVNRLQGHLCPVLDVSWTYDESLLASCDNQGTVIIWKRCGNDS